MKENKDVLLHCCCGICAAHPITYLKELGYNPIAYFYNPNIYPQIEYQKRLIAQEKICKELDCKLIIENYESEFYNEIVSEYNSFETNENRCKRCIELRLLKTIQKAQQLGINNYTSTLTTSPHKDYKLVTQIGQHFSKYFKINYLDFDFKKKDGFLKSNKLAKKFEIYRQNYCGCELSQRLSKKNPVDEELLEETFFS